MPDSTRSYYYDSVALSRAVTQGDFEGAQAILDLQDSPLNIIMPLCWMLDATLTRISETEGVSMDQVWALLVETIDRSDEGESTEE